MQKVVKTFRHVKVPLVRYAAILGSHHSSVISRATWPVVSAFPSTSSSVLRGDRIVDRRSTIKILVFSFAVVRSGARQGVLPGNRLFGE